VEVIEITLVVEKEIERRLENSRAPEVIIEHAGRESWRLDSQRIYHLIKIQGDQDCRAKGALSDRLRLRTALMIPSPGGAPSKLVARAV
jgi:hypothetical protein